MIDISHLEGLIEPELTGVLTEMSKSKGEEKADCRPPMPMPRRPERPGEIGWPSPTPLPVVPPEDVAKTLRQILDRLDAIEKRLENIEKTLLQRQPL